MDIRRTVGRIQMKDEQTFLYYSPFFALIVPGIVFANAPTWLRSKKLYWLFFYRMSRLAYSMGDY
jgi:hypothetical protein